MNNMTTAQAMLAAAQAETPQLFYEHVHPPGIISVGAHAHIWAALCMTARHLSTDRTTTCKLSGSRHSMQDVGQQYTRSHKFSAVTYLQLARVQQPTGAAEANCCAQGQHRTCRRVGLYL